MAILDATATPSCVRTFLKREPYPNSRGTACDTVALGLARHVIFRIRRARDRRNDVKSNGFDRVGSQLGLSTQTSEWFLGYNSLCGSCRSVEEVVSKVAHGKLVTVDLSDPVVKDWQRSAFGEDAPFAPTLFHIRDEQIRAWTGNTMAIRMAMILGPHGSRQVIKSIDELESSKNGSTLGRRQLLGVVGKVAAALALLSPETAMGQEMEPSLSPEDCESSMGYVVNYTASNFSKITYPMSGANCRMCPRMGSTVAATIPENTRVYFRGYTTNGGAVPGETSLTWYRTSGTVGGWIHSSAVI